MDKLKRRNIIIVIICFLIAIVCIVLDQVSKVVAQNLLIEGEKVSFIPNFIDFELVYNTGAAFSAGSNSMFMRILFVIISWVVALGISGYFIYSLLKNKKIDTVFFIILAFILGGDVGNLIDRTFYFERGVVDFISIQSWWKNFGIFNVADSFLTVSIAALIVYFVVDFLKDYIEERKLIKKSDENIENNSENNNEDDKVIDDSVDSNNKEDEK